MKKWVIALLLFPFFLIANKKIVDLQRLGKIVYYFEEDLCKKVVRLDAHGETKYEHFYHYDDNKKLVSESLIGGLGTVDYLGSYEEGCIVHRSPFGEERWQREKEGLFTEVAIDKIYDEEGRLIQKGHTHYEYDQDRLVSIINDQCKIFYFYDQEGKKIQKKTIFQDVVEKEFYLYLGKNEIGSFSEDGEVKWLRIPGVTRHPDLVRAVAIETKSAIYAPIYDVSWNIVKLINIHTKEIIDTRPDPFGENMKMLGDCPWIFCTKRYDPEAGLIDFGHRNYDPVLKQWTTLDPSHQDSNPYRYCFNEPWKYIDPDGRFAIALPIITWTGGVLGCPLLAPAAVVFISGATLGYLGYKGYEYFKKEHENLDKKPPFTWEDLGQDPAKCPGEGFVWKGRGDPKSGKGNWVRGKKDAKEELHPDLNHPDPVGPHWDYEGPDFPNGIRIKPDGTWEYK